MSALRLKAAWHELHCWECRVTWRSWTQRLVGLKCGYSPRLSKRHQALVERARRAEERLAELEGALNWQTSCLACARVLDSSYADHVRAEQAERQRNGFYTNLKKTERTLADIAQMCRTALIPPTRPGEAVLARRILATIEQPAAASTRCPSCDHRVDLHQPDGCWHTVTTGTPDRDSVCPCTMPRAALDPSKESA